ncbi:hypothetical protein P3T29_006183 [Kitasatospora sp. MAP5-34]|nr:hypothetical protein [Kitasatospora sp. MAP5-34]
MTPRHYRPPGIRLGGHRRRAEAAPVACVYAAYDPRRRRCRCRIALAGHPSPVTRPHPSWQGPAAARPAPGVPLGAGPRWRPLATFVALHAHGQLVLYADGLVETRDQPLDARFDLLLSLLAGPGLPPEATCDRFLAALRHLDLLRHRRSANEPRTRGVPTRRSARWLAYDRRRLTPSEWPERGGPPSSGSWPPYVPATTTSSKISWITWRPARVRQRCTHCATNWPRTCAPHGHQFHRTGPPPAACVRQRAPDRDGVDAVEPEGGYRAGRPGAAGEGLERPRPCRGAPVSPARVARASGCAGVRSATEAR